jgi:hypothetical protein
MEKNNTIDSMFNRIISAKLDLDQDEEHEQRSIEIFLLLSGFVNVSYFHVKRFLQDDMFHLNISEFYNRNKHILRKVNRSFFTLENQQHIYHLHL